MLTFLLLITKHFSLFYTFSNFLCMILLYDMRLGMGWKYKHAKFIFNLFIFKHGLSIHIFFWGGGGGASLYLFLSVHMSLCLRSDSWRLGLLVFMELLQGRSETPEPLLQSSRSFKRQGLYWERCGDDSLWWWIRLPTVRKGHQPVPQLKALFWKAVINGSLQGARDPEKVTVQQHCHYVETYWFWPIFSTMEPHCFENSFTPRKGCKTPPFLANGIVLVIIIF